MGRVRVLPPVLAHKIAAGEIVERPASVVKELLENALDADSTRILIEAENGGIAKICVRDDGIGMSREDARTAFEHHATSKIQNFEDLARITTLGFRGEALPSIASVSRLKLRTAERGQPGDGPPVGTEIVFEGGSLCSVEEVAWPAGTEVLIQDLFYNVPARRKFLKSVSTELSHVTRQVMSYALAYPDAEFQFTHQGRTLLSASRASGRRERVFQIFGEEFLANLVELSFERNGVRVSGFASLPHEQRSNAGSQFLYVNGRMVRDRVLNHAIRFAYQDLMPSSAFPVALLFVEIDPSEIDVNVHPCKTEIRFRDTGRIHSAISQAIERAILQGKGDLASLSRNLPGEQLQAAAFGLGPGSHCVPMSALPGGFRLRNPLQPNLPGSGGPSALIDSVFTHPVAPGRDPHGDNAIPETAHLSPNPNVLGQFVESFMVVVERDSVLLVDQHVAHERILFDQALKSMESQEGIPVQRLLVPLTLHLDPHQLGVFDRLHSELNHNGFEVDWFGQQTIVVKGIPAVAGTCDVERLLEEVLNSFDTRELTGDQPTGGVRRLREKLAISIACRAAIKINTPLAREKMHWLLDRLMKCENPYTCPHGRPILLRLSIEDILRGFKRI
jgi:DNA mismatch repair protein MutL